MSCLSDAPPDTAKFRSDVLGVLENLVKGAGLLLARSDSDCRLSICKSVINLLSHDQARAILLEADLLEDFVSLAFPTQPEESGAGDEGYEGSDLVPVQSAALKTLYSICASPEFSTKLTLDSSLTRKSLTSIRGSNGAPGQPGIPLNVACILLASLVTSEAIAQDLFQREQIHTYLPQLLRNTDPGVLYPAISLLSRLALLPPAKTALVENGLLGSLQPFFSVDTAPQVQREAVIAFRRMIAGCPRAVATITAGSADVPPSTRPGGTDEGELPTHAVFSLFRRTSDRTTKMEIGRLSIEICRLVRSAAAGDAQEMGDRFARTVGPSDGRPFTDSIALAILHGGGPGPCGEGWFGFAVLSLWAAGRRLVLDCLDRDEKLRDEVRNVAAAAHGEGEGEGEARRGPSFQNLRLVLAQLDSDEAVS